MVPGTVHANQLQQKDLVAACSGKHQHSFTQALTLLLTMCSVTIMYSGWWATVARDVPSFGVYWCSYEWAKHQFGTNSLHLCMEGMSERVGRAKEVKLADSIE
jgi:hypothetical protein